jgi:chemotaxis protein methyltransferase CheR
MTSSARPSPTPLYGPPPLDDDDFARFRELIYREAGIRLGEAKRDLLVGRLAPRLRELGIETFGDYLRRVREHGHDELVHLLDRISTNETRFFREPRHFERLEQHYLPRWRSEADRGNRPRKIHAWSCACSTGEEPYSIAMCLLSAMEGGPPWDLRVLATDLSTAALAKAEAGVWPVERARMVPPRHLSKYMLRGTRSQVGNVKIAPEVAAIVTFGRFNLMTRRYPYEGAFDLVFCRNVLIYFDASSRRHVLERLTECLAPGGLLFLGHAESAVGVTDGLRPVEPTMYRASKGIL